jgi:hypothetical protein
LFVVLTQLLADNRVRHGDGRFFRGLCAAKFCQLVCAYAATVGLTAHACATLLNSPFAVGFDVH